jgi:hypothetical protein
MDSIAEKRKRIVKLMKEGYSDEEIKQALSGPTKIRAEVEGKAPLPEKKNPLASAMDAYTKWNIDNGQRILGVLGSAGTGMAEAVEEPSLWKKPLAFAKGTVGGLKDAIVEPHKEQKTVSKVIGRPNDTWGDTFKNMGIDILTDPTTYVGAGLIRGGAKNAAKTLGKAGFLAGGAATMASKNPDEAGMAAMPVGLAMGALNPEQWKGVPDGFYSQLEREIGALGKKQATAMWLGKQLKARPTIKPDEWRDVGMDEILASRQEWNPQELLAEVQAKRPKIGFDEGQQWKDYSTARGQASLDLNNPAQTNYKATQLRQQGVNYEQPHWGSDTVAHLRSDISTEYVPDIDKFNIERGELTKQLQEVESKLEAYARAGQYDDSRGMADLYDQIKSERDSIQPRYNTKKDYLVNEVQSDLHQAANDKINPPPKNRWLASDTDIPMDGESWNDITPEKLQEANLLSLVKENPEWTKWNALSPEQKQAKVGYRTPETGAKIDKYKQILNRSVFDFRNQPSRPRAANSFRDKLINKLGIRDDRNILGLPTSPVSSKAFGKQLHTSYKNPHPDLNIGLNRKTPDVNDVWRRMTGQAPESVDDLFNAFQGNQTYKPVPHTSIQTKIDTLEVAPDNKAIARKTWPLLMMKKALKEAVDSGSDRIGVLDSVGIGRILQDDTDRPFRNRWHDSELPGILESFLRSQGIKNAKFGEKEAFSHSLTAPIRDQYQGRFMEITPEIRELVKKGLPLYLAIMAVKMKEDEQAR